MRIKKGVTQRELADYLGLTPKMISFYENEERFPPHDILLKLSIFFDESVDYILGQDVPQGIYMRLAKEAQDMNLPEEDVNYIIDLAKRISRANE